ncbi:hypothetical protein FLW53_23535 [Microbispora sp. SCL1-1]|uniref:hypothetical protein n=1 Tax=unclassified Microbispora TaxID=2614687 RepID=UPI00115B0169|nr:MULTISPECIES: hypothetical protein [unclassified Microbispora]NJP27118.1 hypothetical protein [Microbispora sp. CL1-1]TQS11463.1 hypothetical protein FLW53_23535 [Microbispora sp. SCL1-1]
MAEMFHTGTEWLANTITITRGTVADITTVGVYHSLDPNVIPEVEDFTTVQLVDGTAPDPDPLAQAGLVEALSLIGPRNGDLVLDPGDWQRFVLVQTATEDIIRKIDVITVL